MKKNIGFLNFGPWTPSPAAKVRTAADSLLQSIELAVAAEELGADGAAGDLRTQLCGGARCTESGRVDLGGSPVNR